MLIGDLYDIERHPKKLLKLFEGSSYQKLFLNSFKKNPYETAESLALSNNDVSYGVYSNNLFQHNIFYILMFNKEDILSHIDAGESKFTISTDVENPSMINLNKRVTIGSVAFKDGNNISVRELKGLSLTFEIDDGELRISDVSPDMKLVDNKVIFEDTVDNLILQNYQRKLDSLIVSGETSTEVDLEY